MEWEGSKSPLFEATIVWARDAPQDGLGVLGAVGDGLLQQAHKLSGRDARAPQRVLQDALEELTVFDMEGRALQALLLALAGEEAAALVDEGEEDFEYALAAA